MTTPKYLTISELQVDDKVTPQMVGDPVDTVFTVTDLHPTHLSGGEYRTVAVTLWDGWKEHTSRSSVFKLIERR